MAGNSISTSSQSSQSGLGLTSANWNEEASPGSLVTLAGRVLFSAMFIMAGFLHFSAQEIAYAANAGVPMPGLLVPVAGILALAGGLSILLGYRAKIGLATRDLPGSGYAHDAQFLGSERSHDVADANGHVHEERDHAGRGADHFPIWSRPAESGCPSKFCPLTR